MSRRSKGKNRKKGRTLSKSGQPGPAGRTGHTVPATDGRRDSSGTMIAAEAFVGPLPPPDAMEHYDKTLKGAADRIMKMAEEEQSHCHQIALRELEHSHRGIRHGQYLSAVVAISCIAGSVLCALNGQPWIAGIVLIPLLPSLSFLRHLFSGRSTGNGSDH